MENRQPGIVGHPVVVEKLIPDDKFNARHHYTGNTVWHAYFTAEDRAELEQDGIDIRAFSLWWKKYKWDRVNRHQHNASRRRRYQQNRQLARASPFVRQRQAYQQRRNGTNTDVSVPDWTTLNNTATAAISSITTMASGITTIASSLTQAYTTRGQLSQHRHRSDDIDNDHSISGPEDGGLDPLDGSGGYNLDHQSTSQGRPRQQSNVDDNSHGSNNDRGDGDDDDGSHQENANDNSSRFEMLCRRLSMMGRDDSNHGGLDQNRYGRSDRNNNEGELGQQASNSANDGNDGGRQRRRHHHNYSEMDTASASGQYGYGFDQGTGASLYVYDEHNSYGSRRFRSNNDSHHSHPSRGNGGDNDHRFSMAEWNSQETASQNNNYGGGDGNNSDRDHQHVHHHQDYNSFRGRFGHERDIARRSGQYYHGGDANHFHHRSGQSYGPAANSETPCPPTPHQQRTNPRHGYVYEHDPPNNSWDTARGSGRYSSSNPRDGFPRTNSSSRLFLDNDGRNARGNNQTHHSVYESESTGHLHVYEPHGSGPGTDTPHPPTPPRRPTPGTNHRNGYGHGLDLGATGRDGYSYEYRTVPSRIDHAYFHGRGYTSPPPSPSFHSNSPLYERTNPPYDGYETYGSISPPYGSWDYETAGPAYATNGGRHNEETNETVIQETNNGDARTNDEMNNRETNHQNNEETIVDGRAEEETNNRETNHQNNEETIVDRTDEETNNHETNHENNEETIDDGRTNNETVELEIGGISNGDETGSDGEEGDPTQYYRAESNRLFAAQMQNATELDYHWIQILDARHRFRYYNIDTGSITRRRPQEQFIPYGHPTAHASDIDPLLHGLTQDEFGLLRSSRLTEYVLQKMQEAGKGEPCVVCTEEFKEGEDIVFLPCCFNHLHTGCAKDWLMQNHLCLICRRPLGEEDGSLNRSKAPASQFEDLHPRPASAEEEKMDPEQEDNEEFNRLVDTNDGQRDGDVAVEEREEQNNGRFIDPDGDSDGNSITI